MRDNKSLGLDCFNVFFFKQAWTIVGGHFTKGLLHAFKSNNVHGGLNTANIYIVPKFQCCESVADLKPIFCCNVIYKVISKVIVNRIKVVSEVLVSNS